MLHNIVEKHISHDILATQALVWCVLVCCFEREFLDLTYLSAKFQGKKLVLHLSKYGTSKLLHYVHIAKLYVVKL